MGMGSLSGVGEPRHGNLLVPVFAILVLSLLGACATPPADDEAAMAAFQEANDPLEPFNRTMFEINLAFDRALLRPVAEAYRDVVPSGLRTGVRNVVNNFRTPNILVNDILQGEMSRASESARRLTINTLASR